MIRPSIDEARKLCLQSPRNTVVPICMELFSDIKTPIEVLKCLKAKSSQCYLLESVEGGERWGRYSFLGFEPELTIKCRNGKVEIRQKNANKTQEFFTENPNEILRKILSEYTCPRMGGSPKLDFMPAFTGGFVGYIAYDYIKYSEKKLKLDNPCGADFDDLNLMLFDKIIAFDHLRQKIIIIVNIRADKLEENYIEGVLKLKEIENIIKSNSASIEFKSRLLSEFTSLYDKEYYCEMVEKTKKYIYEGDIFQAVVSNRMQADFEGDLLSAYRVLRTINPSPYMLYIDFDGMQIAGASPQTILSLKDGALATFPLAGTCPRGATAAEDEELIAALLQNEKELAEHDMLVDLGRNDLGKISEFGTVKVESYRQILKFSHVSHIASTVTGKLKEGLDQLDAITAVLPAGTLSGAPKIRAMEIINELEKEKRGVYGGAIGYIDFSGNMDMCIAIRMAIKTGGKVYVPAGAGIVSGSRPEAEYDECMAKAGAIMEALRSSQEV